MLSRGLLSSSPKKAIVHCIFSHSAASKGCKRAQLPRAGVLAQLTDSVMVFTCLRGNSSRVQLHGITAFGHDIACNLTWVVKTKIFNEIVLNEAGNGTSMYFMDLPECLSSYVSVTGTPGGDRIFPLVPGKHWTISAVYHQAILTIWVVTSPEKPCHLKANFCILHQLLVQAWQFTLRMKLCILS